MGSLINVSAFDSKDHHSGDRTRPLRDPYWYFLDTRYERGQFDLSSTYPYPMYVHIDDIDGSRWAQDNSQEKAAVLRIAIRRWIEATIQGEVIYDRLSMSYTRVYPVKPGQAERERYYSEYSHGYYAFYFETLADATGFRLQFGQATPKILPYRPDHPPNPEDRDFSDRWKAEHFVKGY